MKKTSAVIIAALAALSLTACGNNDNANGTTRSAATSSKPFEDVTIESSTTQNSKHITTSTTASRTTTTTEKANKPTTATTTKKATTVTIKSKKTTAKSTTTSTVSTTSTMAQKTTRTATQMELETLYSIAYNKVMEAYYQYQIEQTGYIAELETEIANKEATANAMYVNCQEEMAKYNTESAKIAIYNTYQNNIAPLMEEIDELNTELNQAKEDYAISEGQLQGIIQEEYLAAVEEFQQKTLS